MGELVALICPTAEDEIFFASGLDSFFLICPSGSFLARLNQLSSSFPGAQLRT
jgi:hypothetical protein